MHTVRSLDCLENNCLTGGFVCAVISAQVFSFKCIFITLEVTICKAYNMLNLNKCLFVLAVVLEILLDKLQYQKS